MTQRTPAAIERELATTRAALDAAEADLAPLAASLPALEEARAAAQARHDRARAALAAEARQIETREVLLPGTQEMARIDGAGRIIRSDPNHIRVVQPGDESRSPLARAAETAREELQEATVKATEAGRRPGNLRTRATALRERLAALEGELGAAEARREADRRYLDTLAGAAGQ